MTDRARLGLTLAAIGFFAATLVGTSPAQPPAGSSAARETIPPSDAWPVIEVPAARLKLRLPPGASLVPQGAGYDPPFGRYVQVRMGSGYEISFQSDRTEDFVELKRWYEQDAIGFEGFAYEAADARVAKRDEGPPAGPYWETTACSSPLDGKPLCIGSAGATIEMDGTFTMATRAETLEMVAIARSIEPL